VNAVEPRVAADGACAPPLNARSFGRRGMRSIVLKSTLRPASCEERLLDPRRVRPFDLRTVRDGEIQVRDLSGYWWWRLGAFFRVALRASDGGTEIEIRSDGPLAMKICAAVYLSVVAAVGCLATLSALAVFGVRRGTGSPVAALAVSVGMFVFGLVFFNSGRRREDQQDVADFIRREIDTLPTKGAAEPGVEPDGPSARGLTP
jgi:hypothetical protein